MFSRPVKEHLKVENGDLYLRAKIETMGNQYNLLQLDLPDEIEHHVLFIIKIACILRETVGFMCWGARNHILAFPDMPTRYTSTPSHWLNREHLLYFHRLPATLVHKQYMEHCISKIDIRSLSMYSRNIYRYVTELRVGYERLCRSLHPRIPASS
jgi:hypothetical protein